MKGNFSHTMKTDFDNHISQNMPFLSEETGGSSSFWKEEEGQLSVDILETVDELVVISTMAGAKEDSLEIIIENDLLTIRGFRTSPLSEVEEIGPVVQHFHKECFWGKFSRTIVLPHDVKKELTTAILKHGVLVIRLPKQQQTSRIPITVVDD